MNDFIPAFDFHKIFISTWTEHFSSFGWIALMGFLVTTACGLVGNYLILRRMALVGDAISHSVLPGLAVAFILSGSRNSWAMFIGALCAGGVTTLIIEFIHKKTRIKQDSAIGIAFSTLFAVGVILISVFADKVDLDQDCVLYGEIAFIPLESFTHLGKIVLGPPSVIRMAAICLLTILVILIFYKELLVSSFDPGLASSMGINAAVVHYGLMGLLSLVVVSAFESAGAILVIAMLIMPGATASLLSHRLPFVMLLSVVQATLTSVFGITLAVWLNCSVAGAMVVVASILFCLAWFFSPTEGLILKWVRTKYQKNAPLENIEAENT